MDDMTLKKVLNKDEVPYDLLYLADPSIDAINEYIVRGDCYIACMDIETIGVYVLIKTRPLTLELVNIAIKESYQGSGLGKKLIYSAIEKAKQSGAKTLEVGTGNSSIHQLAFYQKCGFRIVGIDKDFFIKHYEEPIVENGIPCIDMIRLSMEL